MNEATARYSPVYYDAYHFRALTKDRLEDYQGAITDFNKILENIANSDPTIFVERASSLGLRYRTITRRYCRLQQSVF